MTFSLDEPGPAPEDDELLGDLRAALHRIDPEPAELNGIARTLFSWRDPDAQLAELTGDSRELTGAVRGDTDVILRFRAEIVEIIVQLSEVAGGEKRLVGQVEPAETGTVRVRRPSTFSEVRTDALGRFVVEGLTSGPISLRWSPDDDGRQAVETAWQTL